MRNSILWSVAIVFFLTLVACGSPPAEEAEVAEAPTLTIDDVELIP